VQHLAQAGRASPGLFLRASERLILLSSSEEDARISPSWLSRMYRRGPAPSEMMSSTSGTNGASVLVTAEGVARNRNTGIGCLGKRWGFAKSVSAVMKASKPASIPVAYKSPFSSPSHSSS